MKHSGTDEDNKYNKTKLKCYLYWNGVSRSESYSSFFFSLSLSDIYWNAFIGCSVFYGNLFFLFAPCILLGNLVMTGGCAGGAMDSGMEWKIKEPNSNTSWIRYILLMCKCPWKEDSSSLWIHLLPQLQVK